MVRLSTTAVSLRRPGLEKLRAFGAVPHAFLSAPPAAALRRCDDARGNVAGKRLAGEAALLLLGRDRFRRFAYGLPCGVALFVGFEDILEGRQGGSLHCPTGGMKLRLIFFYGNEQAGHFHHADEFRVPGTFRRIAQAKVRRPRW